MNPVPEILPISELRQRQERVLNKVAENPVILTQHGRASVVLVSPEQWNRLIEELEDLQDALDAIEARQEAEPILDLDDYINRRGAGV